VRDFSYTAQINHADRLQWTPQMRQEKWGQITFGC
jgi:hypothetical protein